MKTSYKWLVDLLKDAGYRVRSYSGRFMYGRSCLGFIVDEGSALTAIGEVLENVALGEVDTDKILDRVESLGTLIRDTREDNMGLGTIVYFPSVAWDDSYASEDDEDSEDEDDDSV